MNYVVIMAGGSGERFWPLSRRTKPKQLLHLTSANKTMLQEAIERIEPLVPKERILVITSEVLRDPIINSTPGLPPENVIAEPAKRNTAPCLALAARVLNQRDTNATMAVLTADHFIGDAEAFRKDVATALEYAANNNALVTLGVRPSRPETGYGYIETSGVLDAGLTPVIRFKEKPDVSTALEYMNTGKFLWNSGMFFWSVNALDEAMEEFIPDVAAFIKSTGDMNVEFANLPDISIDYGVMEKADNVVVLPASFPWDDIGSWDALSRLRTQDERGNVSDGEVVLHDAFNNVVVNASGSNHVVAVHGMRDIIIVTTSDATMVLPKSMAQDVKKIVQELKERGSTTL